MQPNDHLQSFQKKVKRIRRLLERQIQLHRSGGIPVTDLESIYELAFLNVFVGFENDLTELLKTNLMLEKGKDGKVRSIFLPKNRALADKLLIGTNRYFQLLPVEQMEKIARVYLKNGEPFTTLDNGKKASVTKAYAIRNHIAHRSSESRASFRKKVLNNVALPKASSSAGYYLRCNLSRTVTYFDHHVSEIGSCLRHLCDNS
jgi:hypothetical protein